MKHFGRMNYFSRISTATVLLAVSLLNQSCGGGGTTPTPPPVGATISFTDSTVTGNVTERDISTTIVSVSAQASNSAAVSYAISAGNDQGYFSIGASNGQLNLTAAGVQAPPGDYRLTLTASSAGISSSATATATITLANFVRFTPGSYQATPAFRNSVDPIVSVQTQTGAGTVSYAITGGDDEGYFSINADGDVLFTTAGASATDLATIYTLTISATSSMPSPTPASAMVVINLPAMVITFSRNAYTVTADDLTAEDPLVQVAGNGMGTISYEISAGNDDELFEIDSGTGELSLTEKGFTEVEADEIDLTVTATSTDTTIPPAQVTVTVTVTDQILADQSTYVATPIHRSNVDPIIDIQARLTSGEALAYTITGGNTDGYFQINTTSGEVLFTSSGATGAPTGEYSLTITISDSRSPTSINPVTVLLEIALGDFIQFDSEEYNAMPVFKDQFGAITTVMATIRTDNNNPPPINYEITSGNDSNFFVVDDRTGVIRFTPHGVNNAAPSADALAMGESLIYTLTIEASSSDDSFSARPDTATVVIRVGETLTSDSGTVIDFSFTDTNFRTTTIIGPPSVSSTASGAVLTYAFAEGSNSGDLFKLDASNAEITLKKLAFNPPTEMLTLTVIASSSAGGSLEVVVNVSFAAELTRTLEFAQDTYTFSLTTLATADPPVPTLADPTVAPPAPLSLGDLLEVNGIAVAVDSGLSYVIANCSSCPYTISPTISPTGQPAGQVMLTGVPDWSVAQVYDIQVSAAGQGNIRGVAKLIVELDPPVLLFTDTVAVDNATVSIATPDMAASGVVIDYPQAMMFPSTEAALANYQPIAYTLMSAVDNTGADASATFALTTAGALSWATNGANRSSYTLEIQATAAATTAAARDDGVSDLMDTLTLTINVADVTAPVITAEPFEFRYNDFMASGVIGMITVSDERDETPTLSFTSAGNPDRKSASGTKLLATPDGLNLVLNTALVEGDIGVYMVMLVATDGAGNESEPVTFEINVLDLNMTPRLELTAAATIIGRTQTKVGLGGLGDVEIVSTTQATFVYALNDAGITGYVLSIDATTGNSSIATSDTLPDVAITGGQDLESVTLSGGASYLYISIDNETEADMVRTYSINASTGALTMAGQVDTDINIQINGASSLVATEINGTWVLCVSAPEDDGIAILSISSTTGIAAHTDSLDDGANSDLGLDAVGSIAAVNNYIYAAGENQISVINTLNDAGNSLELSYSSHLETSTTLPLDGDLYLTTVTYQPDPDDNTQLVHALVVARNGPTKATDGIYLIPIGVNGALGSAITELDGSADAAKALGDPLSVSSFSLGASSNDNLFTLTTADQNGSILQYLTVYSESAWSLVETPLLSLTGDSTDGGYRITDPVSVSSLVVRPDNSGTPLVISVAASTDDGALTVLQTPVLDLPLLDGGMYTSTDLPVLLSISCNNEDDDCDMFDFSVSVQTLIGEASIRTTLNNSVLVTSSPRGQWDLVEDITSTVPTMSAVDSLDQYLFLVEVSDGQLKASYFVALGVY